MRGQIRRSHLEVRVRGHGRHLHEGHPPGPNPGQSSALVPPAVDVDSRRPQQSASKAGWLTLHRRKVYSTLPRFHRKAVCLETKAAQILNPCARRSSGDTSFREGVFTKPIQTVHGQTALDDSGPQAAESRPSKPVPNKPAAPRHDEPLGRICVQAGGTEDRGHTKAHAPEEDGSDTTPHVHGTAACRVDAKPQADGTTGQEKEGPRQGLRI